MQLLHTSITVKNMDESIAFYTGVLGMTLGSRREIKENNAEIAFLEMPGHEPQDRTDVVEGQEETTPRATSWTTSRSGSRTWEDHAKR